MAKKKKRPSMKPVVKAIARTADQLEDILEKASPARRKKLKKLKLYLTALERLNTLARHICRTKTLDL